MYFHFFKRVIPKNKWGLYDIRTTFFKDMKEGSLNFLQKGTVK